MTSWTRLYNELRDIWEAGPGRGKRFESEDPYPVTAKQLVETLRRLHRETNDGTFLLAIDLLEEHDVITEGLEWRRDHISEEEAGTILALATGMAELVLTGVSVRMAAAAIAAQAAVPATSFDAAVKRLQRIWKAHGRLALGIVRQHQGKKLSQHEP